MKAKELVLMVEGDGDIGASQNIVNRIVADHFPDKASPFYTGDAVRVRDIRAIMKKKDERIELIRFLKVAEKRGEKLGGVILLLDGDADSINMPEGKTTFCPVTAAKYLVTEARKNTCAGKTYSFSVVFAMQEFELWILAGHPHFCDMPEIKGKDLENAPRDAKGKIKDLSGENYRETTDQLKYIQQTEIDIILKRKPEMRSFIHFSNAINAMCHAALNEKPICFPEVS